MRRRLALPLTVSFLLMASHTHADEADRAFQEALSLYDAGKYSQACVKFAESYGLDPALGTLQNLAACHEKEGKRALALREWLDLSEAAQKAGKSAQESLARQHVVELSTKLPRLVVRVDPRTGVDKIELDDSPLEPGKEIPVDPGHHRLVFSGAGRKSTTRPIDSVEGHAVELDAPTLESDAPPVTSPIPPTPTPAPPPSSNGLAWPLIGAGAASLAIGTGFGISAILQRSTSDDHCPNDRCTKRGVELNDFAKRDAWVSNISLGLGVVLAGAGVVMLLLDKTPQKAAWNTF